MTEDRLSLMVLLRARKTPPVWLEILRRLNALPGERLNSVKHLMNTYGRLKRTGQIAHYHSQALASANTAPAAAGSSPAAGALTKDVSSLNSPPVPKEPEALFLDGMILVSYEHARKWAWRQGLCRKGHGLNLIAVNAARVKMGLIKFSIIGAL
ncbi:MAG TPA: hypothetical protein VNC39_01550 [Acidocella sp.]|jgi:hypothetical protein|uniref:hypothetical protein n=1 Tax=Acidocella sp. TaxID=50710 RepID=UPI002D005A2B|nr:hypothetical protein [Acidocella sp.]HVE20635.1 hypothetical protein [Acidocella sp.]